MKYVYFVSYQFNDYSGYGAGRCEIFRTKPITSIDDIEKIEAMLFESKRLSSITIIHFQFLRIDKDES